MLITLQRRRRLAGWPSWCRASPEQNRIYTYMRLYPELLTTSWFRMAQPVPERETEADKERERERERRRETDTDREGEGEREREVLHPVSTQTEGPAQEGRCNLSSLTVPEGRLQPRSPTPPPTHPTNVRLQISTWSYAHHPPTPTFPSTLLAYFPFLLFLVFPLTPLPESPCYRPPLNPSHNSVTFNHTHRERRRSSQCALFTASSC